MEEKKYLKTKDKLFYGIGDFASNIFSVTVGSFVLVYLTTALGLNGAIIGTIMLVSKVLDGITDVLFGSLIDRTHSKMGKARPWMFWSTFLLGILLVAEYSIPAGSKFFQYGYFTVVYILFNAICYTANNIAYSTLSALMTRNSTERVQLGTIRYIFAFISVMLVSAFTMTIVNAFGGDAAAWKKTALIFAVIAVVINTISCLMVKELPEEENKTENAEGKKDKIGVIKALGYLIHNRFYLCILGIYICFYFATGILGGFGVYFTQYALGNVNLMQPFSIAVNLPTIFGLFFVPVLVKKFGIYKTNATGMLLAALCGIPIIIFGFAGVIPVLVVFLAARSVCSASLMGTLNAVIARTGEYQYKKSGVHIEGSMFSCSSMGIKVGGGIGSAACGWALALARFNGQAAVQSAYTNHMFTLTYCVIPAVFFAIIALLARGLNIEKAIDELDHAAK